MPSYQRPNSLNNNGRVPDGHSFTRHSRRTLARGEIPFLRKIRAAEVTDEPAILHNVSLTTSRTQSKHDASGESSGVSHGDPIESGSDMRPRFRFRTVACGLIGNLRDDTVGAKRDFTGRQNWATRCASDVFRTTRCETERTISGDDKGCGDAGVAFRIRNLRLDPCSKICSRVNRNARWRRFRSLTNVRRPNVGVVTR